MNVIAIRFDGGCRPTNPGNKYGSFEVELNNRRIHLVSRIELGYGTNNEAEFDTLIKALEWTVGALRDAGNEPKDFGLQIFSDSMTVINRITGKVKTRKAEAQQRMFWHCAECMKYIVLFREFFVHWNGRHCNVKRFGH